MNDRKHLKPYGSRFDIPLGVTVSRQIRCHPSAWKRRRPVWSTPARWRSLSLDRPPAVASLAPSATALSASIVLELVGTDIDGISDDACLAVDRMHVLINRHQVESAANPWCCSLIDTRC